MLASQASTNTHWKLACVPAETIDLQRLTEESNSRICIARECDDNGKAFEVAVDPAYLADVQELQSQEILLTILHTPERLRKKFLVSVKRTGKLASAGCNELSFVSRAPFPCSLFPPPLFPSNVLDSSRYVQLIRPISQYKLSMSTILSSLIV